MHRVYSISDTKFVRKREIDKGARKKNTSLCKFFAAQIVASIKPRPTSTNKAQRDIKPDRRECSQ